MPRSSFYAILLLLVLGIIVPNGIAYDLLLLGDLHYDAPDLKCDLTILPKYQQKEFRRNINRWSAPIPAMLDAAAKASANCEFAVQLGDLVQGDYLQDGFHAEALRRAINTLSLRMKCPLYFVKGNHDIRGKGALEAYPLVMHKWLSDTWKVRLASEKATNYAFTRHGDLFIFFDCMTPDVDFVKRSLEEHPAAKRVFFFSHYPLLPCALGNPGWLILFRSPQEQLRLQQLLAKRNAIVLCAHTHAPSYSEYAFSEGTIRQLAVFSMPEAKGGEFAIGEGHVREYLATGKGINARYPIPEEFRKRYLQALRRQEFYSPRGGYCILQVGADAISVQLNYGTKAHTLKLESKAPTPEKAQ